MFSEAGMAVILPYGALALCIAGIAWGLHYVLTPNAVLVERELDRALLSVSDDGERARRIAEKAGRLADERAKS